MNRNHGKSNLTTAPGSTVKFNLMVAGETGLGKTTLLDSLFSTDHLGSLSTAVKTPQTVTVTTNLVEREERGVRQEITLVDTPGWGEASDSSKSDDVVQYIDQLFER